MEASTQEALSIVRFQFHSTRKCRIHSMQVCFRGSSGACRAQVTMMAIGTQQEGGWQCVDIWNVLGFRVAMPMTRIAPQSPARSARVQGTQDLSRIKRFSAQEALNYGLIDRIVHPRPIEPDAKRQETGGVGLGQNESHDHL